MSKSLGKILGTNTSQHINKNEANIVPYTRNDGTIGYYLTDSNGNNIYDSSQKDYFRKIQQSIQQQSLKPYDNYMSSEERIENMKQGKNLFLDIENNPDANYNLPWYTIEKYGQDNVSEHLDTIDKYAQKYDVDANLVKAIMANEASTGHKLILNDLGDALHISDSQMPMNIQGKTWGNFHEQIYDIKNPEQNIELGVSILKAIYDAVPDKDIAKITTLWNNTGAKKINEYGKRTKDYYINQYWDTSQMTPVLEQ